MSNSKIYLARRVNLILFGLFFSTHIFAHQFTCPSVQDIKNHFFNGWLPLYIDGEELASREDVDQFRNHVTEFDVARWDTLYLENAHCFYRGTDPILNKITFAQDAWGTTVSDYWVWIRPKAAECRSPNVADCLFIS